MTTPLGRAHKALNALQRIVVTTAAAAACDVVGAGAAHAGQMRVRGFGQLAPLARI
jgi:hypothetical protein